jgi:hypothetical protein
VTLLPDIDLSACKPVLSLPLPSKRLDNDDTANTIWINRNLGTTPRSLQKWVSLSYRHTSFWWESNLDTRKKAM